MLLLVWLVFREIAAPKSALLFFVPKSALCAAGVEHVAELFHSFLVCLFLGVVNDGAGGLGSEVELRRRLAYGYECCLFDGQVWLLASYCLKSAEELGVHFPCRGAHGL